MVPWYMWGAESRGSLSSWGIQRERSRGYRMYSEKSDGPVFFGGGSSVHRSSDGAFHVERSWVPVWYWKHCGSCWHFIIVLIGMIAGGKEQILKLDLILALRSLSLGIWRRPDQETVDRTSAMKRVFGQDRESSNETYCWRCERGGFHRKAESLAVV
jgi:hypothetical protein